MAPDPPVRPDFRSPRGDPRSPHGFGVAHCPSLYNGSECYTRRCSHPATLTRRALFRSDDELFFELIAPRYGLSRRWSASMASKARHHERDLPVRVGLTAPLAIRCACLPRPATLVLYSWFGTSSCAALHLITSTELDKLALPT